MKKGLPGNLPVHVPGLGTLKNSAISKAKSTLKDKQEVKKKAQTKVFPVIGGEDRVRRGKTPAGKSYTSTRTTTGPTKVKGQAGPYEKRYVTKQTTSGGKTRTSSYNRKPEK